MSEYDYRRLARSGSSGRARLGGALIALAEPNVGAERAYNRWYENDHFHSGAMAAPWMFSGRRWVSTMHLRKCQRPIGDPTIDAAGGSFLAIYFFTSGHVADVAAWIQETSQLPETRSFTDRKPLYVGWHDAEFATVYDPPPMRAEVALDHPYRGLVLEIIDAHDSAGRDRLLSWLRDDYLPGLKDRGQCLAFTRSPLPPELRLGPADADPRRVVLLWFTNEDVSDGWDEQAATREKAVAASGRGTVKFVAPFLPSVPGTDEYVDQMR
ncbi:hypothetical protein [Rhodococcus opacus]|uniref:hypothetical protein n=1 Tax=Rhodococcus opacus TaxID=37919 RepID=UPI0024744F85|nr:hypothetical protein [Rhodococcus opacus]MDH6291343.1 hypothetical protein [Rhodococcus opacus]